MMSFFKSKKFNSLSKKICSPEGLLVIIATGLIEFQLESVLWQTIASIVVVAAVLITVLAQSKSFGTAIKRDWLRFFGVTSMFALGFMLLYNPIPAHAILLDAQAALVTGVEEGIDDPVVEQFVVGTIVTVMWAARAILVGILIKMGIDVMEGRKDEQPWKDLLQKPVTFLIVIGIVNQIGTMLTT